MFKHLHSFIPFLRFFLFPMLFAAGGDALAALGGDSGGAVLGDMGDGSGDADTGADADTDGATADADADQDPEAGKDQGKQPGKRQAVPSGTQPQLRRPLSEKAKTALNGIKEADPETWKELSRPLWGLNNIEKQIEKHFGEGGLDEAIQTKTAVDGFLQETGYTDLQGVRAELDEYRGTDAKIISGDPTFVNSLPEDIQNGLYSMMPNFVGEWARRDTESYERYFLPLVMATFSQSGVEEQIKYAMYELNRMGLDNADVKSVYDKIKAVSDWADGAKNKIKEPPKKKEAVPGPDAKTQEKLARAEQIEKQQAISRVGSQVNTQKGPMMTRALTAHFGGKIPEYVNRGEVISRARLELANMLGKAYSDRLDQYIAAGDEAGAVKYTLQQVTEQRIQKAVERAAKYLYGNATLGSQGGSGGQQPGVKPGAKPGAGGVKPGGTPGITTLKYNPKGASLDLAASDKWAKELGISRSRLFTSNRAVVKGKGRCAWAPDAEPEE